MKELFIGRDTANQRSDKYLKRYMPGMESGFLYKMFRKKNITLNGKKITGREILKEGDLIRIFFSDTTKKSIRIFPYIIYIIYYAFIKIVNFILVYRPPG